MYGLNREAGAPRYRGWAAELLEDVTDDLVHAGYTIRTSDSFQAPCYPISADADCAALWQSGFMDGPAFDPQKVLDAMRERKVNQTVMARVMGLPSQSAFSNILHGKRRVTAEEARLAYDFLGIGNHVGLQLVPIIGITNAGNWREAIQMPLGNVPVPPGKASEEAFALEISGDSMDLLIEDGGYVVVDPRQKELRDGKCYLIQNAAMEATVKCYRRSPARFEPVSSNPDHKGWLVSEVDFIVLGRIVWKAEPL